MMIPVNKEFAISSWVNDQFETASPRQLEDAPDDVDDYVHWVSDPNSGITGTVYLARHHRVYYSADDQGKLLWWDIGILPPNLR